jgi:hypothetical protein
MRKGNGSPPDTSTSTIISQSAIQCGHIVCVVEYMKVLHSYLLSVPRNTSLNCTMPELVKRRVGSLLGIKEEEGTRV